MTALLPARLVEPGDVIELKFGRYLPPSEREVTRVELKTSRLARAEGRRDDAVTVTYREPGPMSTTLGRHFASDAPVKIIALAEDRRRSRSYDVAARLRHTPHNQGNAWECSYCGASGYSGSAGPGCGIRGAIFSEECTKQPAR